MNLWLLKVIAELLLLLLLSRISHVRLSATPQTAAHQDPPSPGNNTGVGCHFLLQCMKVKSENEVAQSCPTLSNPMDHSPPDSSIRGIFQARVLERVAVAFSDSRVEGLNQEFVINIYTILYIMQINNRDLLDSTGNYIQYLITTYNGQESKKGIYIYVWCTAK